MKQLIFSLITILWVTTISAQNSRVLKFESGISFQDFQDDNFSAVAYKTSNAFYGLVYSRTKTQSYFEVEMNIQNATLISSLDEPLTFASKLKRTSFIGKVSYLRNVKIPIVHLLVGGSFTTIYDLVGFPYLANNLMSYELTSTFNASIELSFSISPIVSYRLATNIPMTSISIRPLDGGLFHMKNLEFDLGGALKSAEFYPTNKLFFLHFHHAIEYKYKSRNIELFYDYHGGYNNIVGKKGSVIQKIGISIPLFVNSKIREFKK